MAKSVHNDILDAALNELATTAENMYACSAEPTTFTEATTTYALADVAITSGNFTGPADGDVSGRKIAVDQQAGVTVDTTGTVTHIAITDNSLSKLLYVTTSTSQAVTSGNTMTFNAWDIEIADPA